MYLKNDALACYISWKTLIKNWLGLLNPDYFNWNSNFIAQKLFSFTTIKKMIYMRAALYNFISTVVQIAFLKMHLPELKNFAFGAHFFVLFSFFISYPLSHVLCIWQLIPPYHRVMLRNVMSGHFVSCHVMPVSPFFQIWLWWLRDSRKRVVVILL